MNDINKLPPERLKILYNQTEALSLHQIKTSLKNGTKIKLYANSSFAMMRKMDNDLSEKNYRQAYLTALKAIISYNHIRTQYKNQDSLYVTLTPAEYQLIVKGLTYGLDVAEKTKPKVTEIFQKEYDEYAEFQKSQAKLEAKKKALEQQAVSEPAPPAQIQPTVPSFNRADKPPPRPSAPPAYSDLEDLTPATPNFATCQKILLPTSLTEKFRDLSHSNSLKNIETCGFLFGEEMSKASSPNSSFRKKYKITHLLIPKQTGTADTCNPLDEAEIIMFTSNYANLVQLGWIHTHPSQTAFLSSVDMHTQFGIQMLMPEAVAIVCSIKYNEDKFLKLTELGFQKVQESLLGPGSLQSGNFHRYDNRDGMQEDVKESIGFIEEEMVVVDQR